MAGGAGITGVQAGAIAADIPELAKNINNGAIANFISKDRDIAGGIAGGIAGNQADWIELIDSHAIDIIDHLDSNQAGTIAGGLAGGIAGKPIKLINDAIIAKSRKELLTGLSLVNNANNFETYIQTLVAINWLTMTIPGKPTSPIQKYLTTLKGRLILEFLKHKKK